MVGFKADGPIWILVIDKPKHRVIVSKIPDICIELVIDELSKGARMRDLELYTFDFEGDTCTMKGQTSELILEKAVRLGLLRPTNRPLDPELAFEAQSSQ